MTSETPPLFVAMADQYGIRSSEIRAAVDTIAFDLDRNPELLEVIVIWIAIGQHRPPLNFLEELRKLYSAMTTR